MIKTNIKMRVTPEQSAKVQEICFKNGVEWWDRKKIIQHIDESYLFISNNKLITYIFYEDTFNEYKVEEIDPELFIRTNGTCKDFKYPMWFKSKKWDYIVKFTGLRHGIVVLKGTNPQIDKDFSCSLWTAHTYSETWKQVPNPDLVTDKEIKQSRGDGGSTNYYELPKDATELRHLIRYKKMSHPIGEIFCAIYRLNDNGEYLRNLKKAKFYIDSEIEEYEKENK